jgi:hypothetical protein
MSAQRVGTMKVFVKVALAAAVATGCSDLAAGDGGASAVQAAKRELPPEGVYNSCEIDTALTTMCEPEDAAIASDGYKWEINYNGIAAFKTGPESLKAWFRYDASIGLGQVIAVAAAINDPADVLTGNRLGTNFTKSLANSCGATTNEEIISCIYSVASSVPGFNWKWYVYDEPGCPNQSIGYCQGTLAGGEYRNVSMLASYIASIDPSHEVLGTQVGDRGGQAVIDNLYSCNNQPPCDGHYPWLTTSSSPSLTFDYYPVPSNVTGARIEDIGTIAGEIAKTIAANYPPEKLGFVGQAFSWYQERNAHCPSVSVCPFPTAAQMQQQRDQALYYSNAAGKPLSMIFWYYWPDVVCLNAYPGCNATANRAHLRTAAFAPFPATPPP